ncbi:hypothetical protein G3M48_007330 [Beauveria asiatica]|uniref:Uncharacterized protein n=1 Tax=Beauveria asiatica TaxID=1069075 RepID=A0AAW0S450_9HYPO
MAERYTSIMFMPKPTLKRYRAYMNSGCTPALANKQYAAASTSQARRGAGLHQHSVDAPTTYTSYPDPSAAAPQYEAAFTHNYLINATPIVVANLAAEDAGIAKREA